MISKNSLEYGLANLIMLPIGLMAFSVILIWGAGMAVYQIGRWALHQGEDA